MDGTDAGVVACNELGTAGLSVGRIRGVGEAAPAAHGGAIEDGEYIYKETVIFEAATVPTVDSSFARIVLSGGRAQTGSNPSPDRSSSDKHSTELWTIGGATLTVTQTCPAALAARSVPYTFEKSDSGPPQLLMFGEDHGKKVAAYFVKQ